jgi:tetratricopeptide (TPR) repeat protein
MNSVAKKLITTVSVLYLLAVGLFVLFSVITYPVGEVLSSFMTSWVGTHALILFFEYLVPIQCTAMILAYSLFIEPGDVSGAPANHLGKLVLALLVLTVIYSVAEEGLLPVLHRGEEDLRYKSDLGSEFLEEAEAALDEENYAKAREMLDLYLSVDPTSRSARDALNSVEGELLVRRGDANEEEQQLAQKEVRREDAVSLIRRAEAYLQAADYYSAHYYATMARELDPSRKEAQRIAAKAWERISDMHPSGEAVAEARLHARKREGYTALMQGDAIRAYYIYRELFEDHPLDPDVQRYFAESKEAVRRISFFHDEAEQILVLPGRRDITFVNALGPQSVELVYFGKLVTVAEGSFVRNVEAMAIGADGEVLYHFTAPYGKFVGNHVNMRCIDRTDEGVVYAPAYHAGSRAEELRYLIAIQPTVSEIEDYAIGQQTPRHASIARLWRMARTMRRYGMRSEPIQSALLSRAVRPFTFMILSIFAVGLGWRLRSRYERRPPIAALLLVPLVPFVFHLLTQAYSYWNQVLFGFLLLSAGFVVSALLFLFFQSVFLVLALFFLAGQIVS